MADKPPRQTTTSVAVSDTELLLLKFQRGTKDGLHEACRRAGVIGRIVNVLDVGKDNITSRMTRYVVTYELPERNWSRSMRIHQRMRRLEKQMDHE
jgi:hypothetical protein